MTCLILRCLLTITASQVLVILGQNYQLGQERLITQPSRACSGTSDGLNLLTGEVAKLRQIYRNCTKIHGNLELVKLNQAHLVAAGLEALDFLDEIEEVTGYVIIAHNSLRQLSLRRLRIIYGDELFLPTLDPSNPFSLVSGRQFGLFIYANAGLETLDLSGLRSVEAGDVFVHNNPNLCLWNSIDWSQIIDNVESRLTAKGNHDRCSQERTCHEHCKGHCWGDQDDQCQIIYRKNCAPQCANQMCYRAEPDPRFCCAAECAGGCTGPRSEDCLACKQFKHNAQCIATCPSPTRYERERRIKVPNPAGTYNFGHDCVQECPEYMLIQDDSCVSKCSASHFLKVTASGRRECMPCDGICPKDCILDSPLNSLNIGTLKNCTKIEGFIELLTTAMQDKFLMDVQTRNKTFQRALIPADLELLSTVKVVTEYVVIQIDSESFTSLDFLRNLETIEGRQLFDRQFGLEIVGTSLQHLGLVNLKKIATGRVLVSRNSDLCYSQNIPWTQIAAGGATTLNGFRKPDVCKLYNATCDEMCEESSGCWGKGSSMCFKCRHWNLDGTCVANCAASAEENIFIVNQSDRVCSRCHAECRGCSGPGADKCWSCKHVGNDGVCVSTCPTGRFRSESRACESCHASCDASEGCTGPLSIYGENGCNKCHHAVVNETTGLPAYCLTKEQVTLRRCLAPGLDHYYAESPRDAALSTAVYSKVCWQCSKQCLTCDSFGDSRERHGCMCANMFDVATGLCREDCSPDSQYNVSTTCYPCHNTCRGCSGPREDQCIRCMFGKQFYFDSKNTARFKCVDVCPPEQPYVNSEHVCTDKEPPKFSAQTLAVIICVGILFLSIVCVGCGWWFRRAQRKHKKMLEIVDGTNIELEKIRPNPKAMPNLTTLRLIKENELRRGAPLGCGAFGMVYKAIWTPPDAAYAGKKVPVAIKVLNTDIEKEAVAAARTEMLDEAAHMASMNHPHLVRLFGVCLGKEMMLVTPLMPLGNLLEFVKSHKNGINSLTFVKWCAQIADGMDHLEQHRLVHRDLAARNILAQTANHVRITDFGLAKMLDYDEEEYFAAGGKMPIKWLAIECIRNKRFTHKSDVWAYGVTLWELFTYGEKPYKDISVKEVPEFLEKGERLPHPKICSLDVYMLLIKCWMVDAESRPSFKELKSHFERMRSDPGRYLAIQGDHPSLLRHTNVAEQLQRLGDAVNEKPEDLIDHDGCFTSDLDCSLTVSPTTPSKPLVDLPHDSVERGPFPVRSATHRTPSTGSSRYGPEPSKNARLGWMQGYDREDNYLRPNSERGGSFDFGGDSENSLPPQSSGVAGVAYTPIVSGMIDDPPPEYVQDGAYYNDLGLPCTSSMNYNNSDTLCWPYTSDHKLNGSGNGFNTTANLNCDSHTQSAFPQSAINGRIKSATTTAATPPCAGLSNLEYMQDDCNASFVQQNPTGNRFSSPHYTPSSTVSYANGGHQILANGGSQSPAAAIISGRKTVSSTSSNCFPIKEIVENETVV